MFLHLLNVVCLCLWTNDKTYIDPDQIKWPISLLSFFSEFCFISSNGIIMSMILPIHHVSGSNLPKSFWSNAIMVLLSYFITHSWGEALNSSAVLCPCHCRCLSHSPPIIGGAGQQSVCFSLAKPPCNQHFNQINNWEGTLPCSQAVIMIDSDDIECGNHCQRNPVGDFLRKFIFQQDNIQKPDLNLTAPEDYGLITTRSGAL